jgi:SprT protein
MKKPPHHWKDSLELCQEANNCMAKAGYTGKPILVYWNSRLRTTAGLAYGNRSIVTLNPKLKPLHTEVLTTLKHELAHLLAQYRVGRKRIQAHGPEWRQACIDLGIPNEKRCHDMQELVLHRTKLRRKFFYLCPNCGIKHARVRKPKPKRPLACFRCCKIHNNGTYHPNYRLVSVTEEKYNCVQESKQIAA